MTRKYQPTICARAIRVTLGGALLSSVLAVPSMANASFLGQAFKDATTGDKVTLAFVNYYKSAHRYDSNKLVGTDGHKTQYEWTQSAGVFYKTGNIKLGDSPLKMNLNLGYSHVFALDHQYAGDQHNWQAGQKLLQSTDCFWTGGEPFKGQYKCNDVQGFGKVPVANAMFVWKGGNMVVGDGFFNTGMITTANADDATLSSYRGVMARHKFGTYVIDGAFVTGFMEGLGDKMGDLSTSSNYYQPYANSYDYLYTARLTRNVNRKWGYMVSYGEAHDYLRRFHTNIWMNYAVSPETNLFLKGQYYFNKAAGDLWQEDVNKGIASFDDRASLIAYEAKLTRDAWNLWYGYHTVDAPVDSATKTGAFSYGFGGAKGYLSLATSPGYSSFRRDGGQTQVVGISYDLRHLGVPDLKLTYRYHWDKAPVKHKTTAELATGRAYEHVLDLMYRPRAGKLKGFEFSLRSSMYRPDRDYASLNPTDVSDKADINAIKAIMGYSFNL